MHFSHLNRRDFVTLLGAWSLVWPDRVATLPAYRPSRPILLASGSKFCVRLCQMRSLFRLFLCHHSAVYAHICGACAAISKPPDPLDCPLSGVWRDGCR